MPFALTVDRRDSRRESGTLAMSDHRDRLMAEHQGTLLDWQISAGDELQALYTEPAAAVEAALHLAETGNWHVGLGLGHVDAPLPSNVNEATGTAFVCAREAVEAAKTLAADAAVRGPHQSPRTQQADALMAMLAVVRARRTPTAREAALLADRGLAQQAIAEELGIKQSSVSRRLATALWQEERATRAVLVDLLQEADAAAAESGEQPVESGTEEVGHDDA